MTAKFPTLIAESAPRPESDTPSSREAFGASSAHDDFSGLISQALNRHTAQGTGRDGRSQSESAHRSPANNSRSTVTRPGSAESSARTKQESSSREADSDNNDSNSLAAANAATAVAQAPAPPPADSETDHLASGNPQTAPDQDGDSVTPGGAVAGQPGLSAEPSGRTELAAGLTPTVPTATELVELQKAAQIKALPEPSLTAGGIPAAPLREQMKSTVETDEIAGSAMQKLPRPAARDDASADSRPKSDGQSANSGSHPRTEPVAPVSLSALADKFNPALAWKTEAPAPVQENLDATARVERVSQIVNREVVMLRQSGAATLAVSLKVDSKTELFLQLTNHDGQIQASLRFERGEVAGLDRHWGQLQESLARQNVQLLPLEQKPGANGFQSPSGQTASHQSDSPPDQPREQGREPREQTATSETGAKPGRTRVRQNKSSGRSGWETWA